jgi:hypothetical protein
MPISHPPILQSLIAGTDRLPTDGLPAALAAFCLRRKAGRVFPLHARAPEVFEGVGARPLPEPSRGDLILILAGAFRAALPEFVGLLQQHHFEWPPEHLPEALDLCLKNKQARAVMLPFLQSPPARAAWLARQHPEWQTLFAPDAPAPAQKPPRRATASRLQEALAAALPRLSPASPEWPAAAVQFLCAHPDLEFRRDPALQELLEGMAEADWNQAMIGLLEYPVFWEDPAEPAPARLLQAPGPWRRELLEVVLARVAEKIAFAFPVGAYPLLLERAAYAGALPDLLPSAARVLPPPEYAKNGWKPLLERFHAVLKFRTAMHKHLDHA